MSHNSYRQARCQNADLALNMGLCIVNRAGYFTIWGNNYISQNNLFSVTLQHALSENSFNTNFATENKERAGTWKSQKATQTAPDIQGEEEQKV